jgi:hypothetical protein
VTTLAAMRDAMAEQLADAEPGPDPVPFAELPPATAPCGPNAARTAARELAEQGAHSHLAAYGETVCLSRQCGPALDALRGLM